MSAAFRSGHARSTTSPTEKRLDAGFEAFNARRPEVHRWTPKLRAERWMAFDRECQDLLKAANVPSMFREIDIEQLADWLPRNYVKLARTLLALLDHPQILAVGGDRGTGKSALAAGLVVKFCECGRGALYRTVAEFFHELSDAPWEAKQAIRTRFNAVDLLVLDEVHVRDDNRQWQDNELTTLIDHRYREGKSTVLVSNLKSDALKTNLGESVWRRLIETGGMPIETNWPRIQEVAEKTLRERREKAKQ